MSVFRRAASLAALFVAVPLAATAHIAIAPREAPADAYARISLAVTHGCQGSPTVSVTVRIPDEIVHAKPQAKAGWSIEIKRAPLPKPIPGLHGGEVVDRVSEVTWSGSRLLNEHFDDFGLSIRTPALPGAKLHFVVTQKCEVGAWEWNEIPAEGHEHHTRAPAPALRLR